MGGALGYGDMKRLMSSANPVLIKFGPATTGDPFGQFTSNVTGRCSIFVLVDTNGVHLELTGLGTTGGVDGGRYLMQDQWNDFSFVAVLGEEYSFQVTKDCNIALAVAYSPLMS